MDDLQAMIKATELDNSDQSDQREKIRLALQYIRKEIDESWVSHENLLDDYWDNLDNLISYLKNLEDSLLAFDPNTYIYPSEVKKALTNLIKKYKDMADDVRSRIKALCLEQWRLKKAQLN